MNEIIKSLMNHRSVRNFRNEPVSTEILNTILSAGTRAATGGNLQLYSILVLDDKATLQTLDNNLEVPFIKKSNCPLAILMLADQNRVRRWLTLNSNSEVINNRPYNFFMSIWDALIALQNIVIAAESLGLGTCYLGSGVELDIQELYNTPEYVFPAGLVCIGYPSKIPELSMRLPLEAVIHKNRYHTPTSEEINLWYQERDKVWDKVTEERKRWLNEQGIIGIAQALAVQKFSSEVVEKRSKGILNNLRKSRFDFKADYKTK